eukprot:3758519-Pleurochrysis_carterae.AAC.3
MRPSAASGGYEWVVVHVVAIKDSSARNKAVPVPMRRRQRGGARGAVPECAYDALRAMWDGWTPHIPVAERTFVRETRTRLFTGPDGVTPCTTGDSRRLAKAVAAVIWLDFGARAIVQRGRWHTDITQIYQRALADTQLHQATAGMEDAGGADMEALFVGWTQPASFRRYAGSGEDAAACGGRSPTGRRYVRTTRAAVYMRPWEQGPGRLQGSVRCSRTERRGPLTYATKERPTMRGPQQRSGACTPAH